MDGRTQLASEANDEFVKNDFLMATTMLTARIRNEPNNHGHYLERSICHHKLGDFQASLDDANSAIRLDSTDYTIHYQKGLALLGLRNRPEGLISFKKAIELRAKQETSKISDIFNLIRDVVIELNAYRRSQALANRLSGSADTTVPAPVNQSAGVMASGPAANPNASTANLAGRTTAAIPVTVSKSGASKTDPVDSTTDKPLSGNHHSLNTHPQHQQTSSTLHQQQLQQQQLQHQQQQQQHHHHHHQQQQLQLQQQHLNYIHRPGVSSPIHHLGSVSAEGIMKNDSTNLVATTSRNITQSLTNNNLPHVNVGIGSICGNHRVSSTASHSANIGSGSIHQMQTSINISPRTSSGLTENLATDILNNDTSSIQHHIDPSKASQFEWNIRRSERIFLHANEPGTSGPQFGILSTQSGDQQPAVMMKTHSNPSSINDGRGPATKRPIESFEHSPAYSPNKIARSKDNASSYAESDVDVDDSCNHAASASAAVIDSSDIHKRVLVAPSSSMPATSQLPTSVSTASRDDSYSSKYKRLRRDRERARRGTSKLCTIKPSDLEELSRLSNASDSCRQFMRVIAPIDGWLYSGQLSVDANSNKSGGLAQQYVVKLDGDATGSSYLFDHDTVLNDVIKEVKVKSVSELRKGARICCYWSRQYKCLSTGVVTSRTFEATKSLVSVKYDNGDLSALPLEDLRLLPPDYPKYMSNCDPLLLARNGGGHISANISTNAHHNSNRIVVESKLSVSETRPNDGITAKRDEPSSANSVCPINEQSVTGEVSNVLEIDEGARTQEETTYKDLEDYNVERRDIEEEVEDETIPPTNETIDFITSESTHQDENQCESPESHVEQVSITKDNLAIIDEAQVSNTDSGRVLSEENNYGIEYRPWVFEGPPRRSKRHGRTYRDNYSVIRRGNEIIRVGDSAELMPRDESILPFIAKIDGFWATGRGEMRVRVRWYYRLVETEGEPSGLKDGENALFETDHFDENDVQSIYRSTRILSWTDYHENNLGHVNKNNDNTPKIFYLAGYYDPVRRVKHLRSDVKEAQSPEMCRSICK